MDPNTRRLATVNRLINKEGQTVVYKSQTAPVADESQPWKSTAGGYTLNICKMVFVDSRNYKQFLAFIKGTDIPEGGKLGLMAPQSWTPAKLDTVYRDQLGYAVEGFKVIDPGGVLLLYKIEIAAGGTTAPQTPDMLAAFAAVLAGLDTLVNVDLGGGL